MATQLVGLYSSRVYRDYIRSQGHRVPHYLQRIDTDPSGRRHAVGAGEGGEGGGGEPPPI